MVTNALVNKPAVTALDPSHRGARGVSAVEAGGRTSGVVKAYSSCFSPTLLAGEVAIVTGGATGIGLQIARAFVEHGARVALLSRDGEKLRQACSTFADESVALGVVCDIADPITPGGHRGPAPTLWRAAGVGAAIARADGLRWLRGAGVSGGLLGPARARGGRRAVR